MRRLALTLLALLVLAPAAQARDSLAPPGSPDQWLPREDWVYRHWLPFDAAAAARELRVSPDQLEALLFDDRRTLVALGRAQGLDPGAVRDRLVAPALEGVTDPERVARLRSRAWRVMTQGHLAQHLLYHPYHGVDVRQNTRALFGLTRSEYYRGRLRGRTPLQLATQGGTGAGGLATALGRLFTIDRDEGLRLQVTSATAADERVARQEEQLPCWRSRVVPGDDRAHPYAQQHVLRDRVLLPRSTAQLRADERELERFRRALPGSCWSRPARWTGPALGPEPRNDPDPDPALRGFVDPSTAASRAVPRMVCALAQ